MLSLRPQYLPSRVVLIALCLGVPTHAAAQRGTATFATCASLLSADELTKAVGLQMQDMGPDARGTGVTECSWMLRGSGALKTVFVSFEDLRAIAANSSTPETLFETYVSASEEVGGNTRTRLPGIGQQAAMITAGDQKVAVVRRADGVARIVANGLTNAQVTNVARAVATP